jgi:hypothetical protein
MDRASFGLPLNSLYKCGEYIENISHTVTVGRPIVCKKFEVSYINKLVAGSAARRPYLLYEQSTAALISPEAQETRYKEGCQVDGARSSDNQVGGRRWGIDMGPDHAV